MVLSRVLLAIANAIWDLFLESNYNIYRPTSSRGSIDAGVLRFYSVTYTLAVCRLALRAYPPSCPDWLPSFNVALVPVACQIFTGEFDLSCTFGYEWVLLPQQQVFDESLSAGG